LHVDRKLLCTLQTAVNQQAQQASQQPQQPLVVNPKTKTALANMLSIRLQSGTTGAPHLSPQQPGAQVNCAPRPVDWVVLISKNCGRTFVTLEN
jgi:hypothetical protein